MCGQRIPFRSHHGRGNSCNCGLPLQVRSVAGIAPCLLASKRSLRSDGVCHCLCAFPTEPGLSRGGGAYEGNTSKGFHPGRTASISTGIHPRTDHTCLHSQLCAAVRPTKPRDVLTHSRLIHPGPVTCRATRSGCAHAIAAICLPRTLDRTARGPVRLVPIMSSPVLGQSQHCVGLTYCFGSNSLPLGHAWL